MKYTHYTLVGLIIILISFIINEDSKVIEVDGYYNDISPSEKCLLYRTLDFPELDGELSDYELDKGIIRVLNLQTGEMVVICTAFMKEANSYFLNDSLVAVPREDCIKLYDLYKMKFESKPLLSFEKGDHILQFSLNNSKTKAAVLLLHEDKRIEELSEYSKGYTERKASVVLQIIDLKSFKKLEIENYDYTIKGYEGADDIGDILWHGDQIIYSLQGSLYYYQLGNSDRTLIKNRIGAYAIDGDEVIYGAAGYGKERWETEQYRYKIFSLKDLKIKDTAFEEKPLYAWQGSSVSLNFYTTCINQTKHAVLSDGYPPYSYYMRLNNGKFKKQEKTDLILYKGKNVMILQRYDKRSLCVKRLG